MANRIEFEITAQDNASAKLTGLANVAKTTLEGIGSSAAKGVDPARAALDAMEETIRKTQAAYANLANAMVLKDAASAQVRAVREELEQIQKAGGDSAEAMERFSDALAKESDASKTIGDIRKEIDALQKTPAIPLDADDKVTPKVSGIASYLKDQFEGVKQVAAGMLSANVIMAGINALRSGFSSAVNVLREGVAGAGEFERYETQLGVLLKSTDLAKERLQELAVFGQKTPFELPEIVRAEKVLTAFGLTAANTKDRFGKTAAEIRTVIGDVASGTGAMFEEVADYIGRFASGSTGMALTRLQQLGVVTREELTKMGLEFSKNGELQTDTAKATSVLLEAMTAKFGGMMDKQSATFEGMQSNLADWMGQTKRLIAEPIFNALKDNLGELLTVLNGPAVQEGIKNLSMALADLAKQVSDISLLLLKGDIEEALTKISNPETASGIMAVANAIGKVVEWAGKLKEFADSTAWVQEGLKQVSVGVEAIPFLGLVEKIGNAKNAIVGLKDALQGTKAGTDAATLSANSYSMTTSNSSIVARALANEAKYGADSVQVLAMNMTNARAAAESFNTGIAANAAAVQALAASAQQQGQVMATAFGSEAVQSAMTAFNATVATFQAQQLQQEQQAALASEQAQVQRNAQLLMSEAQYQQQRAVQVAQGEAQIAALQAAGQAQKAAAKQADLDADLANSDAKHQASVAQEEAQYSVQQQIQERALLVQRVQQLEAYKLQLQDQRDQTLRVLGEKVREAGLKAGIEETALNAMVGMIYSSGSERLKGEYTIAQETLKIEKSIADGKMNSAQEQIEALLLIQKAAMGNAEAAAAEAKKELDSFKIDMPALPAIDTSQFTASVPAASAAAGAAGAASSKPLADKFTSALSTINTAIDSAQSALVKLLGFDLPEGWQAGLEKVRTFSRTLIAVMEESAKEMSVKDAKTAEKISKAMDRTLGAFAKFAQVADIFKTTSVTDAEMAAWLGQYKRVVGFMLAAIQELEVMYGGYENVKNLYKSAKRFKTLLDSVLIELSVVKVVNLPDLNVWKQQIISVVSTAVDTVGAITGMIGATNLKKAASDASTISTLIGVANSDLGGMKLGVLPDLTTWKQQFVALVRAAVEAMAEAEVSIGSIPITRAAELAPKLQTLMSAVSQGFDQIKPAEAEGFEERITLYFQQAQTAFQIAVAWLYDLYTSAQVMVTQAAEIAGPVGTVFGITADLEKFVPAASGFEARATEYVGQLRFLGGLLVAWLSEIKGDAISWVAQAANISEHVKTLFGLIGVDLASVVPQDAKFAERATAYVGQLRWLGGQLYGWMNEIVQAGVSESVKLAAEVSGYVATLFNLIGTDLSKLTPQDSGFQARALAYIAQLKWTGGQIFGWLREIKGTIVSEVKEAGEIASSVKALFDLLGLDLTQMIVPGANFDKLLDQYLTALSTAADKIMPWLQSIKARYEGDVLKTAGETAAAIKAVIDLLSVGNVFADMKNLASVNVVKLVTTMVDQLKKAVDLLVPALQAIGDKWGGALETVKATANNIKALVDALAGVATGIQTAMEAGTINVPDLALLLRQVQQASALISSSGYTPGMTGTPPNTGGSSADLGEPENTASSGLAAEIVKALKGLVFNINITMPDGSNQSYPATMDEAGNIDLNLGQLTVDYAY